MPTEKKGTKKTVKPKKQEEEVKKLIEPIQPTKFILHIAKCGTDTFNVHYNQIEHDNPILLGLNGVKIICDGMAPKTAQPFYQYLLACAILNGLKFNTDTLNKDIRNIADIIKNLSLKGMNGGKK